MHHTSWIYVHPEPSVLIRKGQIHGDTQTERPCNHGGRNSSDAAIARVSGIASNQQELGENSEASQKLQEEPVLLTSGFHTSGSYDRRQFYCSILPVCGTLLWQSREINALRKNTIYVTNRNIK